MRVPDLVRSWGSRLPLVVFKYRVERAGGLKVQLLHTHKFFGQVTVVEYVDEGGELYVEIYSRRGLLCKIR